MNGILSKAIFGEALLLKTVLNCFTIGCETHFQSDTKRLYLVFNSTVDLYVETYRITQLDLQVQRRGNY